MNWNKVLKAILKVICFFCLLITVDYVVGLCFNKWRLFAVEHNPTNTHVKSTYTIEYVSSDIIIIGDSRASRHYVPSIITEMTGMTSYNCGEDGAYLEYQSCLINLLLERHQPKVIIWDLGVNCLSADADYGFIDKLYPYYDNPNVKQMIDGIDWKQKYKMLSRMYRNNGNFYDYTIPLLEGQNSSDNGYEALDTTGYDYPDLTTTTISSNLDERKLAIFINTICEIQNKGVKLVIALSPHYFNSNVRETEQFKTMVSVIDKYGLSFIDYYDKSEYIDSSLFKDSQHMNDRGARRYTKELMEIMLNYDLIEK